MPILGSSTGQVLFRHQHAIPACRVQGIVVDMLYETDELAYVGDPQQRDRCRVPTYLESYFSPDPAQTRGFRDCTGTSMWYVGTAWHGACFVLRSPLLLCSPGFRSCTMRL